MARRVTEEDIVNINEAYLICKNYTKVAESTGWSTSTVKKYIIDGYTSQRKVSIPTIGPLPLEDIVDFLKNHSDLTLLTTDEKAGIEALWIEMIV